MPSIFQRTMENLLQGIPHTSMWYWWWVGLRKSTFGRPGVNPSRRRWDASKVQEVWIHAPRGISSHGVQPTGEKVWAIANAPVLANNNQLQSFVGLINYYAKFLTPLSTTLAPFYALLQKKAAWIWGDNESKAFETARSQLASSSILIHYCSSWELLLVCEVLLYRVDTVPLPSYRGWYRSTDRLRIAIPFSTGEKLRPAGLWSPHYLLWCALHVLLCATLYRE
jgi:hypothetical protein